jgi:hypothetical protein
LRPQLDVSGYWPHASCLLVGALRHHGVVHQVVLAAERVAIVLVQGEGVGLVLVIPGV